MNNRKELFGLGSKKLSISLNILQSVKIGARFRPYSNPGHWDYEV